MPNSQKKIEGIEIKQFQEILKTITNNKLFKKRILLKIMRFKKKKKKN